MQNADKVTCRQEEVTKLMSPCSVCN